VVEGLNNKAKVTMRKSYGFRTFRALELALYHSLGKLPEPRFNPRFLLTNRTIGHGHHPAPLAKPKGAGQGELDQIGGPPASSLAPVQANDARCPASPAQGARRQYHRQPGEVPGRDRRSAPRVRLSKGRPRESAAPFLISQSHAALPPGGAKPGTH